MDYAPDENIQDALLTYLSELTLTDEEPMGLHLPNGGEFHIIHWRRSKRTEYTASTGFSIILSKERAWNIGNKDVRETVRIQDLLSHFLIEYKFQNSKQHFEAKSNISLKSLKLHQRCKMSGYLRDRLLRIPRILKFCVRQSR